MSNVLPFTIGVGGGLALWHLLKHPTTAPTSTPRNNDRGSCSIQLDALGVTIDGLRVDRDEAVRRCTLAGSALITVDRDVPAALYAALTSTLRDAGVLTNVCANAEEVRNGRRNAETFSAFTLVTYPDGVGGANKITRWFRTEHPMTWQAARDQLARAGVLDANAIGPGSPGYWKLVTDPRVFMTMRATPMPGSARNSYISTTFTLVTYPEGVGGPKQTRWFLASQPTMWDAARDRLAAAGLLDANANNPTDPGYWILVSSANAFREAEAEPLPGKPKRTRDARGGGRYALDGGRVILRDGEPVVRLERVDLGDSRYALSPHDTDELGATIVRLLNRRGAR